MTTTQFIEMLKKADPEGNSHIRMPGGVPVFAEQKEGYWDGPYSYINENGEWVYSALHSKIDIHCTDIDDYVSDMIDTYNAPAWDDVKAKFKFDLDCYSDETQRKEKEDSVLNVAKKAYDSSIEMHKKFRDEGEKRALERADAGWTWFQNKLVDAETGGFNTHHYYTWKVYDNGVLGMFKKEQGSNLHNVEAVYKSGLFERLDNGKMDGYYQWVLKR